MNRICKYCKKEFYARLSRVGKYCSKECQGKHKTKKALKRIKKSQMKKCSACQKILSLSMFSKDASQYDGLNTECKKCGSIRRKKYRASENGFKVSKRGALKKFGLTLEQYNQILHNQGGACAICGREETMEYQNGRVKQLAVDHDHKTGKVRGLLCNSCNRGLGLFMDSPLYLSNAIEYLSSDEAIEPA